MRTPLEYDPPRQDNLFLWTIFLLLLLATAFATWIGVYVVFGQPELPISYKILRKFKRLEAPQRFRVNVAPQGEFLSAEKLYNRYNAMNPVALREANRQMERSYLRNYPISPQLAAYITGRFTIMKSYELAPTDFFPSGVVALASSDDFPRLLIEHVYPASASIAPLIQRNLQTGMDIELRRTYELTTVLHATKLPDGHVLLTVVPLNYGSYIFKGTSGGFTLEPPPTLNVAAPWPLLPEERRREANEAFINARQSLGLGPLLTKKKDGEKPAEAALKGVDAPIEPETTPTPAPSPVRVAAATPPPPKLPPGRDVKKPPGPVAAAATPAPSVAAPTPAMVAAAGTPIPRAVAVSPSEVRRPVTPPPPTVLRSAPSTGAGGVSLQPFLGAPANAGGATNAGANARSWQTYPAGRAPAGKAIRVADIAGLSKRGGVSADQPLYLNGQFVVRAVGENKTTGVKNAVLRATGSESNVRVIVAFPAERSLPARARKSAGTSRVRIRSWTCSRLPTGRSTSSRAKSPSRKRAFKTWHGHPARGASRRCACRSSADQWLASRTAGTAVPLLGRSLRAAGCFLVRRGTLPTSVFVRLTPSMPSGWVGVQACASSASPAGTTDNSPVRKHWDLST